MEHWKTVSKKDLKVMKKVALDDLRAAYTKPQDTKVDDPESNGPVRV